MRVFVAAVVIWMLGVCMCWAQAPPRHPTDQEILHIRRVYHRIGPIYAQIGLAGGVGYDSDPFPYTPEIEAGQSDLFVRLGPRLDLAFVFGRRLWVEATGRMVYQHYTRFASLRDWLPAGAVRCGLRLGPGQVGAGLGTRLDFYRWTSEIDVPLRVRQTFRSVQGTLPIGIRWTLDAEWREDRFRFRVRDVPAVERLSELLDRTERTRRVALRWAVTARTTLELQGHYRRYAFVYTPVRDSREVQVGLVWDHRTGPFFGLTVEGGYRWLEPESPEIPTFRGWVGRIDMDLNLGRRWWVLVQAGRGPGWSAYTIGTRRAYYIATYGSAGLGFGLMRGSRLRVMYGRDRRAYVGDPDFYDRGQRWTAGWDLRVGKRMVSIDFTYWRRETNLAFVLPKRWTVTLTAR